MVRRRISSLAPFALLRGSWDLVRRTSGRLLLLIVGAQLAIALVASPLIIWLIGRAFRAGGMYAIDINAFVPTLQLGLTVAILLVSMLLVSWLLVLEFTAIVALLNRPDATSRELLGTIGGAARRAVRPSSWLMLGYLLLVLPLSGFGFTSALIDGVQIPAFITGELQKTPLYAVVLTVLALGLVYLNVRCGLALPIFATSNETGNSALKRSWHATSGLRPWSIVAAVALLLFAAGAVLTVGAFLLLVPTEISDRTVPETSWLFASVGLGIGQVAAALILGYTVAFLAGILLSYAQARGQITQSQNPARVCSGAGGQVSGMGDEGATTPPSYKTQAQANVGSGTTSAKLAGTAILASIIVGSIASVPLMSEIADQPSTLVVAHRGWTEMGVENTIESMRAAAELGADFVEFDVMRTADDQFVAFHDTTLGRLTDSRARVADMTLEELTSLTVRDPAGHEAQIPSLIDYMTAAKQLDQPLLIEVKFSGAEPDAKQNVADLVEILQKNDLLEGNLLQSIDLETTQELKRQLPEAAVGYVMPFAGVALPDTLADFLVLEQSSATDRMRQRAEAAGLGYVVWTVNSEDAMRRRFREDIDALITNKPDLALKVRGEMGEQTGLAPRLRDLMSSMALGF